MQRVKLSLFLITGLILVACNSGPEPVAITDLTNYKDEVVKFEIQYPSNWVTSKTQGQRFMVFSSNEGKSRFVSYASEGFPGVLIDVYTSKLDTGKTINDVLVKSKIFDEKLAGYKQSTIQVDGVDGIRLDYGFPLEDGDFKGILIAASRDNITYTTLKIETFGGSWDKYASDFDKIIKSWKIAITQTKGVDTVNITEELPFPSDTLTTNQGNGFSISIPKNFYLGKANAANVIASYNYIGDRRGDCNIQVDVLDGSKTKDLKKASTELASKYPGSPTISANKVGGTDGFVMNWSPSKDVKSRVYFAKQGDKIFRVTMNWFTPEEANYLPIFEKCIASINFK